MPDSAAMVVSVLYLVSSICILWIAGEQASAFLGRLVKGDDLQPYRLMWALLLGPLGLGLLWRAAVWFDLTLFDQSALGLIATRWPFELMISLGIAVGCLFATGLYIKTRMERQP